MRNNLDSDVTKSYRMNTQFTFVNVNDIYRIKPIIYVSHRYISNSLAAVLHINKSTVMRPAIAKSCTPLD